MKNLLYITTIILLVSSCRSIEKMVDQGQYDEAIVFAAEKLSGKKNKKTKHVKGLEKAFEKISKKDMDLIHFYDGNSNPENWDLIYDIALKIKARQNRIEAFLPLISKDGYKAEFQFVKTNIILNEAMNGAMEYHYKKVLNRIEKAREGDKNAARSAYSSTKSIEHYTDSYKDVYRLKREAIFLGKTRVLVDLENNSSSIIPLRIDEILESIDVENLNSLWKEFYLSKPEDLEIDYIAKLNISHLDVSPEREIIEHHTDSKKVKDGWRYALDKNGNVRKDSLGNDIKIDKFRTITAHVTEIVREKSAIVGGSLELINTENGNISQREDISVEAVFSDFISRFRGNRKALCHKSLNSIGHRPLPFPNDYNMILDASENLKSAFKDALYIVRI